MVTDKEPKQMEREYMIDGANFATLEEFYDHVGTIFAPGQFWGRNLDAFNDILFWPYSDEELPYCLIWRNSSISRKCLGYEETIKWLEERVQHCDASNVPHLSERLQAAKRGEGATLFDMVVEIIQGNDMYLHLTLA